MIILTVAIAPSRSNLFLEIIIVFNASGFYPLVNFRQEPASNNHEIWPPMRGKHVPELMP